jgi:hypothetical protein
MNFRSLRNKTQGDGKYIFAQPSMLFRNKALVNRGLRLHIVREDEVTRPDLIALEYYGDQTKTDLILKWNGISDPFGLQPGDELIIPPSGVSFVKLERPAATEDNKIKNQFLQSKRFTKKDQRRIEALKKKYNKEVLLPPNVIPLGQKNYKFDKDGNIIFGAQAQNGPVNPRSGGNATGGSGGSGSGNGTGSGGTDAVVDEIFNDLGQDLRDSVLAAQGSGNGSGSGGNGSGSGNGKGLTETQLNNLLDNKSGGSGRGNGSGNGSGSGGNGSGTGNGTGNGTGSGRGTGNTATNTGNNNNSGSAPSGSNNASGVSNDGAPCN